MNRVRDKLIGTFTRNVWWKLAALALAALLWIATVGEPDLNVGDLPGEGQPLSFSIEIGVRPKAKLGEYKGLEVGKREAEVADEAVDEELEKLRDRFATLETAERPAESGKTLSQDL